MKNKLFLLFVFIISLFVIVSCGAGETSKIPTTTTQIVESTNNVTTPQVTSPSMSTATTPVQGTSITSKTTVEYTLMILYFVDDELKYTQTVKNLSTFEFEYEPTKENAEFDYFVDSNGNRIDVEYIRSLTLDRNSCIELYAHFKNSGSVELPWI